MLIDLARSHWEGDALEGLKDFIRLPSLSTAFDPDWREHGFLLKALENAKAWGEKHFPEGTFEILTDDKAPPALFVDIPGTRTDEHNPAFFYGHFDKQPETLVDGWEPFNPIIKDGMLYGRGSVDDGYSFFTALTALKTLDDAKLPRPRATGLFETNEESGSAGLATYLNQIAPRVGSPAFMAIIDLGAQDYDRLWLTQSLRGTLNCTVTVKVLAHPVHSGMASGLVPDSFRILRQLLNRVEDPETGAVRLESFKTEPDEKTIEAMKSLLPTYNARAGYQWAGSTQAMGDGALSTLLTNTWYPTLTVVGADLPHPKKAGALIHAEKSLRLSCRVSPGANPEAAFEELKTVLTTNVPYDAEVTITDVEYSPGFMAPAFEPAFQRAVTESAQAFFNAEPGHIFCGASIGTLRNFQLTFPKAPFINTGSMGPGANAHAPFEHLNLPYNVKLTAFFADLLTKI